MFVSHLYYNHGRRNKLVDCDGQQRGKGEARRLVDRLMYAIASGVGSDSVQPVSKDVTVDRLWSLAARIVVSS